MQLYTIGHSAHPIQKFVGLLEAYAIQALVDVRSVPASRFHPQYNKAALQHTLAGHHIEYIFAGQQLGGRPNDPSCYEPGAFVGKESQRPRANFAEMMKRDWFIRGVAELVSQASQRKTAILCSEEDPLRCHRHALIANYMRTAYPEVDVQHIRGNGALVSAAELFAAVEQQLPGQLSFL
jgi:uncharacterized protein (DUF488 family)